MDASATVQLLGRTGVFGSLSETDRAMIAGRMRRVQFVPEQMIFSRGDPGREIYLVLEGRIRLSILSSMAASCRSRTPGRAASLARSPPSMGESGRPERRRSPACRRWPSAAGAARGDRKQPQGRVAAIHFLCRRLRETDQRLEAIALHRIEVRLARLLLSALRLQSPGAVGKNLPLDLGMSQGELALLIGASRPKVNIALATLEDMGGIERAGARLLCNTEVLESVADMQ
jgi:CRP-like cAMP-binding protein